VPHKWTQIDSAETGLMRKTGIRTLCSNKMYLLRKGMPSTKTRDSTRSSYTTKNAPFKASLPKLGNSFHKRTLFSHLTSGAGPLVLSARKLLLLDVRDMRLYIPQVSTSWTPYQPTLELLVILPPGHAFVSVGGYRSHWTRYRGGIPST